MRTVINMIEAVGTFVGLILSIAAVMAIVVFAGWFVFVYYPGGADCWLLDEVVVGDLLRFFAWLTGTHSACP
jgi:hypothetical protein